MEFWRITKRIFKRLFEGIYEEENNELMETVKALFSHAERERETYSKRKRIVFEMSETIFIIKDR